MIKSTTVFINLDQIKIPNNFSRTIPAQKVADRLTFYKKHGAFDREIILDEDYNLIDGYTTYLVSKMLGLTKVRALRIKVTITAQHALDVLSERINGVELGA